MPIDEDVFEPLADRAVDMIEPRSSRFRGQKVDVGVLFMYARGLREDGETVAADGVERIIGAYIDGIAAHGPAN